jgi:hypothetical protein
MQIVLSVLLAAGLLAAVTAFGEVAKQIERMQDRDQ